MIRAMASRIRAVTAFRWLDLGLVPGAAGSIVAYRHEPPRTEPAGQLDSSPIAPRHAFAGNEFGDRRGTPHFARLGDSRNCMGNVYGKTIHTLRPDGHLAGV
jgi:hypothetical protein